MVCADFGDQTAKKIMPEEGVRTVNMGFEIVRDVDIRQDFFERFFLDENEEGRDIVRSALRHNQRRYIQRLEIDDLGDDIDDGTKNHNTLHHNAISWLKELKNDDVQSYYTIGVNSDLDLLKRIFLRKMTLMTRRGRMGYSITSGKRTEYHTYVTIQMDDLKMDLFESESQEGTSTPKDSDNIVIINGKSFLPAKLCSAQIELFLHIENCVLEEGRSNFDIPANLASVISINKDGSETCKADFCYKNLRDIYVKLEDIITAIENSFCSCPTKKGEFNKVKQVDESEVAVHDLITKDVARDWWFEDQNGVKYVDFYTFLATYAWLNVVLPIRVYLEYAKALKNKRRTSNGDSFSSGRRFVNTMRERYNMLYYESMAINFSQDDYNNFVNAVDHIAYPKKLESRKSFHVEDAKKLISEYFRISTKGSTEGESRSKIENNFLKYINIDGEYALYYQDKRLWFGHIDSKNSINHIEESSIWWDVAWGIILSDLLVTISQMFLSYNEKIERHTIEGRRFKQLREITSQAVEDFKAFYDVGTLSTWIVDAYSVAKQQFRINNYYETLKDKLAIFESYEIASAQHNQNSIIASGGSAAVLVLIWTLALVAYQTFRVQLLLWIIGITGSVIVAIVLVILDFTLNHRRWANYKVFKLHMLWIHLQRVIRK